MTERVRTFDDAIITAFCIDCGIALTGPLGVHFINPPGGPPHLEILVIDLKRNEQHAIARVDIFQIPVVLAAPVQATGHA
jgi:hypothetical protein